MKTRFFGEDITKGAVEIAFSHLSRMPKNNQGYDFISPDGTKIEVKASHGIKSWMFSINKNVIADRFLLIAFDEKSRIVMGWDIPSSIAGAKYAISMNAGSYPMYALGKPVISQLQDAVDSVNIKPCITKTPSKHLICVPDELNARLTAWIAAQAVPPSRSAVIQAALREFLDRKGVE